MSDSVATWQQIMEDMYGNTDDCSFTYLESEEYRNCQDGLDIEPSDNKVQLRKNTPVFSGVLKYFPNALKAVARASKAGNDQHHKDKPLHWDRSKSGDELDALTRHLMEAGEIDTDLIRHSAKVCWRALANLQKELEENGEAPLSKYNLNKEQW